MRPQIRSAKTAANRPNIGQIANVSFGATVETPVHISSVDVNPIHVGALPEPIAEGDREKALQSLLLDPTVTDFDVAKKILEDYLETYRQYLPQFWR